jgi:hypothetical protein
MKTWHVLTGVTVVAALILGWGAIHASKPATKAAPRLDMRWVPSAQEVRARAAAADYVPSESRPTHRRVVPKTLKLPAPKRYLPSTPADEFADDDLCLDVPPSLDECAGRYTAESMNSCIEYRVSLDDYQATYC